MNAALAFEGSNLSVSYGRHQVLRDVSISVGAGEFCALFGHNGAGKTTLLRTIAGVVRPGQGTISIDSTDITRRSSHARTASGIVFVPQSQGVFPSLSVDENLRVGGWVVSDAKQRDEMRDYAFELFPILASRRSEKANGFSGGQRQMLAIAMALMACPRLLMLDEPSTGLAPVLVDEVLAAVSRIRTELGTSVLLVEQNINKVLPHADSIAVLKLGEFVFQGSVQEFEKQDLTEIF